MARTTVVALKQELIAAHAAADAADAAYGDLLARTVEMALTINALRAEVKRLNAERVATVPLRAEPQKPVERVKRFRRADGSLWERRQVGNRAILREVAE